MSLLVGVDTLCWHLRIERGAIGVAQVLDEAAGLGAACVQVNLHHVRTLEPDALAALRARAEAHGLRLYASGDFLGAARQGDTPAAGRERVARWLERAGALGSPSLRLVSGFYRAELAGRPDLIDAERRYVTAVLRAALPLARRAGIRLLLENHSDFTAAEYRTIVDALDGEVGVFLDLINPVSALEDPLPVVEALAPFAWAAHAKDYELRSIVREDDYHRHGFELLWRYPGEGVARLPELIAALRRGIGEREIPLTIEGLDNSLADDQRARLAPSLALLRDLAGRARDDAVPGAAGPR